MKTVIALCFLTMAVIAPSASIVGDSLFTESPPQSHIITSVYAAAYYCVYNTEIDGVQTVTKNISDNVCTLKASFLYGGLGVAMQGTGKTAPAGQYVKYTGSAGPFVHISGPNAGTNLDGHWVINPQTIRNRYARLGVTDFTGFGNLALLYPDQATYAFVTSVTGSSGRTLTPWQSVAADPAFIPSGQSLTINFKSSSLSPLHCRGFAADDAGPFVKGKRIDIYLGEGRAALDQWTRSGGNRFVDICLQ